MAAAIALVAAAGCSPEGDNNAPVTAAPPGTTAEAEGQGGESFATPSPGAEAHETPDFKFARENDRDLLTACEAEVSIGSGNVAVTAEIESIGMLDGGRVLLSYVGNPQSHSEAFWLNSEASEEDWTPNQTNTMQLYAPLPNGFANGDPFSVHVTYLPADAPLPPADGNPVASWAQWSSSRGLGQSEVLELYSYHIAGCSADGSLANQQNP